MASKSGRWWCLLCDPRRPVWVSADDPKGAWADHYRTHHANEKRTA